MRTILEVLIDKAHNKYGEKIEPCVNNSWEDSITIEASRCMAHLLFNTMDDTTHIVSCNIGRVYIVDTPLVRRMVDDTEMERTYIRAKGLNRIDGNRGPLSILYVANTMGISRSIAGHMIRLNIEQLDYIEMPI